MTKNNFLKEVTSQINNIDNDKISEVVKLLRKRKKKSTIFIAGNGASASIASHAATDLSKSAGFRALTFNESNLITCLSNDYKYENWIKEAVNIYSKKSDIVILVSSSGMSKNIIQAAKYCKTKKITLISLSGFSKKNILNKYGKFRFHVNSKNYNVVETCHLIILLSIVEKLLKTK
tara:strand:+ start:187 stop:717 length:531 start_codon:yes stop_codon:yes gene_type:complete